MSNLSRHSDADTPRGGTPTKAILVAWAFMLGIAVFWLWLFLGSL